MEHQVETKNSSINSENQNDNSNKPIIVPSQSKLLFNQVMKRCRVMRIVDVKHSVLNAKNCSLNGKGNCWDVLVSSSLSIILDNTYQFTGIACVQIKTLCNLGTTLNYAFSTSCKNAEEDVFKKIVEKLDPLESFIISSLTLNNNHSTLYI
jgi:hypothetical protein